MSSPAAETEISAVSCAAPRADVLELYRRIRENSLSICEPLRTEDYVIQTMDDVSPPKWHLAHTTWFFETFLLDPYLDGYERFHSKYSFLFNSYYEAVGERHPRSRRGLLSRPTVSEVYDYRSHVDLHIPRLIEQAGAAEWERIEALVDLGLNHEEQHQELLITDLKHILAENLLSPAYVTERFAAGATPVAARWVSHDGGLLDIGFEGEGFSYDNEGPRHRVYLEPFQLASQPVTNAEFIEFIEAGGYENPAHWLSEGWTTVQEQDWRAPLYWTQSEGAWTMFTLNGPREVRPEEPVCHVSYFEADAYARWRGKRLPTEPEWECAAASEPIEGNFYDTGRFHPAPADGSRQFFGDVWEWTQSPYTPYPGFQPAEGAVGEYNGKFMCNQHVLRGGSCATSRRHIRPTYRNFFSADARWQFSGLRLASD
jgi:ergothioneine biosynthesis protein EgtB